MKVSFVFFLGLIIHVSARGLFDLEDGYRMLRKMLSGGGDATPDVVSTRWIEQPLDHFNENDKRKWNMRYFERIDMWQPGGPIIVFIGGESEANPYFLKGGMAYELTNETRGASFMSEHRYYGKSMPLPNSGAENLQYLSSVQALADLNRLISKLKEMPQYQNSKVAVVGGSYPGNLAAWVRLLYPNSVDAAVASSAPVLAKENFFEYLETVADNYRNYGGNGCYSEIESIFERYDQLFRTRDGKDTLKSEENICERSNLTKPENQHLFTYSKAGYFMANSQYGSTGKIKSHCDNLMQNGSRSARGLKLFESTLQNLGIGNAWVWDDNRNCNDIDFDKLIEEIKRGGSWLTSWVYQKCTEFSYAKSSSSANQPFGRNIPLETFYEICSLSFGSAFNDALVSDSVNETNKRYGGRTPNVTKVVFLNGDMDPWHRLGITKDLSDEAPAILIPQSSHCRDLLPTVDGDSEDLINARRRVKTLIKSWMGLEQSSPQTNV